MCRHTTVLARIDNQHRITCCDHNAVHVTWKRIQLSFSHTEFVGFARFIARQCADAYWTQQACRCIVPTADGRFEVRIGDAGIRMSTNDLLDFGRMFESALETLGSRTAEQVACLNSTERPDTQTRTEAVTFSLN